MKSSFSKMLLCMSLLLPLSSCSVKETDPAREAVCAEIVKLVGEGAKVSLNSFEKIDSTTMLSELDHRKKVMTVKLEQDLKLASDYASKGMSVNSSKHAEEAKLDRKVLEGMEALYKELEPRFSEIVYYDYRFSGYAVLDGAKTEFTAYWASVSPDGKVLSLQSSEKGLHKSLSHVIPGFRELFQE